MPDEATRTTQQSAAAESIPPAPPAPPSSSARPSQSTDEEVIAFLAGRSAPCPRCSYNLCNITSAKCPECGEPLVLKVGTPRARFGWLLLAMAPGCFSGVAAMFVMVPIIMTMGRRFPPGQGMPWPLLLADGFGFISAGCVLLMYRHRHRFMAWPMRRQAWLAIGAWGVHIGAFMLFVLMMILLRL